MEEIGWDGDTSAWSLVRILEWALPAICRSPAISIRRGNSAGQPLCDGMKEDIRKKKVKKSRPRTRYGLPQQSGRHEKKYSEVKCTEENTN